MQLGIGLKDICSQSDRQPRLLTTNPVFLHNDFNLLQAIFSRHVDPRFPTPDANGRVYTQDATYLPPHRTPLSSVYRHIGSRFRVLVGQVGD